MTDVTFIQRLLHDTYIKNVGKGLLLGVFLLPAGNVNAENKSISSLWKDFATAQTKDQPKTAIAILQRIQVKAEQRKSYGDLLMALSKELSVQGDVSQDSLVAAENRFVAKMNAWRKTNGVLATLCQTVMNDRFGVPQVDSLLASKDAPVYLKKNEAWAYRPFIEKGVDSRYFDNDLLSVIASHTNQWKALHKYYSTTGKREAACIAASQVFVSDWTLEQYDSLINVYQNLPECCELAVQKSNKMSGLQVEKRLQWIDEALRRWPEWKGRNRLVNARKFLTDPTCRCEIRRSVVTTDTDVMLKLQDVRNLKGVKVTLRRMNAKAKGGFDLTRNYEKAITLANDYEYTADSLSLGRLPLGRWEMTLCDTEGKLISKKDDIIVTDLKVITMPLPKNKWRIVVVNAITGQPVPDAELYIQQNGRDKKEQVVTTDAGGEYIYATGDGAYTLCASKGNDTAMQSSRQTGLYDYYKTTGTRKRCNVYTDRAIYRPGQTVKVALTNYKITDNKDVTAADGDTLTVTLRDAQYKEVEKKQVITDRFGAASVDFQLPADGRNGSWSVVTRYGRESIRVEEYKRPTFDVTMEKPETVYDNGDTVMVKGVARTYSGMPVANAQVAYSVQRHTQWWWFRADSENGELLTDTVKTAADGSFLIKMPMIMPKDGDVIMPRFYNVKAMVSVTGNAGESHSATLSLPLSNRKTHLSCSMAAEILADSVINVTVSRRNAAGTEIEGNVKMYLDGVEQSGAKANMPYALASSIQSGEHTLMAVCEGDTVKNAFVTFRKGDERPMTYKHQWCYQSATSFPENGGDMWMQVGSSDNDVNVFYSVSSGDSIIAQGKTLISNANITRTLSYKEAYGDGLTIALAWVKDGELYSRTMQVRRSLPSKKLNMEWTTFRDRLVPGQKEQWTVRITNPDGSPAKARMMAVLYDKSLEQLQKHQWRFADMRSLNLPNVAWRTAYARYMNMYLWSEKSDLPWKELRFSDIPDMLGTGQIGKVFGRAEGQYRMSVGNMMTQGKSAVMMAKPYEYDTVGLKSVDKALYGHIGSLTIGGSTVTADGAQDDGAQDASENIPLRSDFAETAFFMPAVMTDSKGSATVMFTLPESVTTWRFMALAHDETMRNATLVADAVAQKPLMVQPNMPRFLRYGDKATVAATVANQSDKVQNVKVMMAVLDAKTEQKLLSFTQKVTVKNGETGVVTFPVDAEKLTEGAYICRFTAQSARYTDGEQHYLTVLSDEETVTSTMAYSFVNPTDTVLSFADMIPSKAEKAHLKVDYVDNPAWLMMETLPEMADPKCKNAIALSNALYANRVAAQLKWSDYKSQDVLVALKELQNPDGSFSWWQGMDGSSYMTMAVVKTLARLEKLCGRQEDTQSLLDKAFRFLQGKMDDDVRNMKQWEKNGTVTISQIHLDWLYALTLKGRDGGASADYLLRHLVKDAAKSDMATKAVAAIVLDNNGKKSDARTFVEAIKQHTVYRKDMGRYFDSYRAAYSWCDYRIPTHTLAIEALRAITPKDRQTIAEMQRWLLNSKRTQEWGNPYNTVNAVHAFFGGDVAVLTYEKGKKVLADRQVTQKNATVTLHKQSECESWAAAYVTFRQKTSDVKATATGLSVNREVLVNGKAVADNNVKVGDKVTVRITVTADRDYDFVSVTDNKAACLEPVAAISGYRGGCYQEVKDTATAYHFNRMAKGTHIMQSDYYVDRAGNYRAGTVTAECAYANEFRGMDASYRISVNK